MTRIADVWRAGGLKQLWFRSLARTVYRRAVLVEHSLDAPPASVTSRASVEIGLLKERDAADYLRFRQNIGSADFHCRLQQGHVCFAAWHEGRIVSAAWIATGRVWIEYLAREIELARDEAYLYESFTAPAFRGNNIPALRGAHEARYFRDAGYRRLVAVIMPENAAGLRHAEKAGWNAFGMMGYVKLGAWRWDFCRADPKSRPPGEAARPSC